MVVILQHMQLPLVTTMLIFSRNQKQVSVLFPLLGITIRREGSAVFDKMHEGIDGAAKSPKLSASPPPL